MFLLSVWGRGRRPLSLPVSLCATFMQFSPQGTEEMRNHCTLWDSQLDVSIPGCLCLERCLGMEVRNDFLRVKSLLNICF